MDISNARSLSVAPEDFRNAMRNQVSTVSIVACGQVGGRSGLTATAACSLSESPAMVTVCVNRNSRAHDAVLEARCFSLNFLSAEQIELADAFSGKTGLNGESRFKSGTWSRLFTGAPILDEALVNLDCELESTHEFSTHSIFAGVVRATRVDHERTPLLYAQGRYLTLNHGRTPSRNVGRPLRNHEEKP